ncbi:MAG: hypothetical protein IJE68_02460 [Clostridia bacterium]|nr:hypothetical protein [Clostridia bacterium]
MKKVLILLFLIIIIIAIIIIKFPKELNNQPKEEIDLEITEIKQETGMTAQNELYEITVEHDGTKILNIKPEIQYKIAFAGIIKNTIPEINKIDKIFENQYPKDNGIWIDTKSRDKFLELLKDNTNNEYEITEQGYLKIKQEKSPSEEDEELQQMIEGENKYVITISGIYYEADRVNGQIFDNFFEDMDPYQPSKIIEWNNNKIICLTTNKEKKLTNEEILQELG